MDKNQREERRRQEDIALNRGLLWVGAAILMELLLMLVNKYYINYLGPGGRFQRGDGHRPYHDLF